MPDLLYVIFYHDSATRINYRFQVSETQVIVSQQPGGEHVTFARDAEASGLLVGDEWDKQVFRSLIALYQQRTNRGCWARLWRR